ncbi:MAG: bifunctional (p)ppGpp synthetase/guanosine-3',5'-bis(diphosphate) 3'-pyrophosphohydrolase [Anaerolineales bacterium]
MNIDSLMASLPEVYSPADRELILRAYRVAEKAHEGQMRASGEPYITHCLSVASILVEKFRPAPYVIQAGLLHDTVEDTEVTLDDLRRDFGERVAILVDGVTKLTGLPRVSRVGREDAPGEPTRPNQPDPDAEMEKWVRSRQYDAKSETLRKVMLAVADQPEVVMIKLADRLHNMRTLHHTSERKQKRIARETLDIFAPLANRLGIWQMKWELEDLCFRYLNPQAFLEIANALEEQRDERERQMQRIIEHIRKIMQEAAIPARVSGRSKHIYSIYRKMQRKGIPFEMLSDIRGVRIIVPSFVNPAEPPEVNEKLDATYCYAALGVIHSHWRPIPHEFDDYIAAPKNNNYRSLHTAVVYDDGKTLEVQIRTEEMHREAEEGIAAHWRYKEDRAADGRFEQKIRYIRSLMDWRQDVNDAQEFMDGMKTDVFADRVYVITPRGDMIDLPAGATPIDFAYHIHTEIGNRCRGAKVNGKLVPLDYELKTGDRVEIVTVKSGGPSRDWLNPSLGMVKTQRAKAKIRYWFKTQARDANIARGRDQLEHELKRVGYQDINLENLARDLGFPSVDALFFAIGCGDFTTAKVVVHLELLERQRRGLPTQEDDLSEYTSASHNVVDPQQAITVVGMSGLLTSLARCCRPLPGEPVVGYITRGRGVTIHRQDCPNMRKIKERDRIVQAGWGFRTEKNGATLPVPVRIEAYDRLGLMREVSTILEKEGVNMPKVDVRVNSQNIAVFDLLLEVSSINQLSRVLTRIENLPNVFEAVRVHG